MPTDQPRTPRWWRRGRQIVELQHRCDELEAMAEDVTDQMRTVISLTDDIHALTDRLIAVSSADSIVARAEGRQHLHLVK